MSLPTTLGCAGVALALAVLFGALGARPSNPAGPPRLIPWRFLMMIAIVAVIATLVHAVALLKGGG
ncbi:MAG: hypothetical protein ACR2F8_08615 [Caulobacteraceae bacterium]